MSVEPNGWFQRFVVESLKEQRKQLIEIDRKVDGLAERVTRQEERGRVIAGLWGALGAFLTAGGGVLLYLVFNA